MSTKRLQQFSAKRLQRLDMIASQMLKGCDGGTVPEKMFKPFRQKYNDIVVWVDENAPPQMSTGACGAIAKAALCHGREKLFAFCNAIKNCEFDGPKDPAHVLWLWLSRDSRKTNDAYRRTVTVLRAYLNDKKMQNGRHGVRPAVKDFFEWDDNFDYVSMDLSSPISS